MLHLRPSARLLFGLVLLLSTMLPLTTSHAATGSTPYASFRKQNTAADFRGSTLSGMIVRDANGTASVSLDLSRLRAGTDRKLFKNRYWYGTLVSPELGADRPFDTAIASWNAVTTPGTWLKVELRTYRPTDQHWTKYYTMGIWASGTEAIQRRSIGKQVDRDGRVATDSLLLSGDAAYTKYQYRVTLYTANKQVSPKLSLISVVTSSSDQEAKGLALTSDQQAWGVDLDVPMRSQMIYKGGGEVWCSPTSTAMVLAYWGKHITVPQAASATYDYVYGGTGNWAFNTAWAGANGFEAYVTRLASMEQVEEWISAKVPVIMSYAMRNGELDGTPYSSTSGHIMVIRGFDANGNVIVNDPAFRSDNTVRTVYNRAKLEELWLKHSGGTVYLIYPKGYPIPSDKAYGSW